MDLLIATAALLDDAPLVTRNVKDFTRAGPARAELLSATATGTAGSSGPLPPATGAALVPRRHLEPGADGEADQRHEQFTKRMRLTS